MHFALAAMQSASSAIRESRHAPRVHSAFSTIEKATRQQGGLLFKGE
jgi:hypothetical protein